jgi:hypothetical protein
MFRFFTDRLSGSTKLLFSWFSSVPPDRLQSLMTLQGKLISGLFTKASQGTHGHRKFLKPLRGVYTTHQITWLVAASSSAQIAIEWQILLLGLTAMCYK